jgi:photosystem II stability/assembly factor-like uncharacterized protein
VAVGGNTDFTTGAVIATTDGGRTWVPQAIPSNSGPLTGVSCPTATNCVAVGVNGNTSGQLSAQILATTNGGATWVAQVAPSSAAELLEVTCQSAASILAVGQGQSLTNPFAPGAAGAREHPTTFPAPVGSRRDRVAKYRTIMTRKRRAQ